ncbi:MAG: hypothetical protein LUG61_06620 [Lachnospiraceae bacterium]|nr:hypothetical protein [Lachnospiraceae bacterium]
MNKKMLYIPALILIAAYVFFPRPASDLVIRLTFEEVSGDSCELFYMVDSDVNFSSDQKVSAQIDYDSMQAEFWLDGSVAGHLTGIRIDLPHETQVAVVKTITVSSAGVIQKEFDPRDFFADSNISGTNNLEIIVVSTLHKTYLSAQSDDPYLIISDELVSQVDACYSDQRAFRLLVCVFLAGFVILSRRKIFETDAA